MTFNATIMMHINGGFPKIWVGIQDGRVRFGSLDRGWQERDVGSTKVFESIRNKSREGYIDLGMVTSEAEFGEVFNAIAGTGKPVGVQPSLPGAICIINEMVRTLMRFHVRGWKIAAPSLMPGASSIVGQVDSDEDNLPRKLVPSREQAEKINEMFKLTNSFQGTSFSW